MVCRMRVLRGAEKKLTFIASMSVMAFSPPPQALSYIMTSFFIMNTNLILFLIKLKAFFPKNAIFFWRQERGGRSMTKKCRGKYEKTRKTVWTLPLMCNKLLPTLWVWNWKNKVSPVFVINSEVTVESRLTYDCISGGDDPVPEGHLGLPAHLRHHPRQRVVLQGPKGERQ